MRPGGWQRRSVIGKSSPAAPVPESAAATSQAQAQANTSTAAAQAALNNVNQVSPYGTTTYDTTGSYTTPEGQTVPRYTQTTALSPTAQALLDQQGKVAGSALGTAGTLAGQAGSSATKPLNFNTPFSSYLNQGPQQLDQNATDAIYNKSKSFLDPQWNQTTQQLQDQLSRQGIPVGSEAYNNAIKQLDNSKTQAYDAASNSAIAGGSQAASNLFGLAQAGQNQNIQEQQLAQQQPISLLQQILGLTPSTPGQPISSPSQTQIGGVDVTGATAAQNQQAMQAYQSQIAQNNATTGGAASLAATAATAAAIYF